MHRADEWYAFTESVSKKPGYHVLITADEKSYTPGRATMAGDHPLAWWHCVGKGHVVYLGAELCHAYLHGPTTRMMKLLRTVLTSLRAPTVTLEGPQCVGVNTRIQPDGRWTVHVHNAPGGLYRYPQPANSNYLHAVGEVVPVHNLVIQVTGPRVKSARSGLSGQEFKVEAGTRVLIPDLDLLDVVLLSL